MNHAFGSQIDHVIDKNEIDSAVYHNFTLFYHKIRPHLQQNESDNEYFATQRVCKITFICKHVAAVPLLYLINFTRSVGRSIQEFRGERNCDVEQKTRKHYFTLIQLSSSQKMSNHIKCKEALHKNRKGNT